ncbi:uncharacterized protein LOC121982962 [Zingiber officinale]|uniref:Embryo sac development arrest 6 n=1 Tax=Zingiber officinale TaxID=94328 RepID=A0A8J5L184_ZINOF|nr:uncharacterized protein LOC121982962 [Zingiber officinale]KAG6507064.1 hypothetical protein ZIOFF_032404 [Zingiber officinale]
MSSQSPTLGATRKRKDREPSDEAELGKPAKRSDNRLLAGLLAHEFLTRGSLFGSRWDLTRSAPPEPDRKEKKDIGLLPPPPPVRYAEASHLVMRGGAHVAGVVNPTQLGRWLQQM